MINLCELFSIYTSAEIDALTKRITGKDLTEQNLYYKDVQDAWKFLGGNSSNGSSVNILKNGEKGLVERITNAIDAVIEKQCQTLGMTAPASSEQVIKKAFPRYYENTQRILRGETDSCQAYNANNLVTLVVNDGSRSNKPTFDIIDRGTGISGPDFPSTILSLSNGNKLSRDKGYLIGAFGQGGSTSLPFTYATLIISKIGGKFYWTVVKDVDLKDYKNSCYVYLTIDGAIPEAKCTEEESELQPYLRAFMESESGTMVRMIETDISKEYRENEASKPRSLSDYLNTQLFNVRLPVNIIDARRRFSENVHKQSRQAYGSYLKLHTWKYVREEYSGTMEVEVGNRTYKVDYYVILPPDEDDWGNDRKAEDTMKQFNVTSDPILYTVNGQTITTESFTKLKNAGLNFLKNRLLVVIDLDVLGNEKFKFFTSDRAHIKDTDQTHGFVDKVIAALVQVEKLKEINSIVAQRAISTKVDNDLIAEIANEVKGEYNKFLKGGTLISGGGHRSGPGQEDEEVWEHEIQYLEISMAKYQFFCDQEINVIVKTGAEKHINKEAFIYCFIDGKNATNFTPSYMNGRIQYSFSARAIPVGVHTIKFEHFDGMSIVHSSQEVSIEVLKEKSPETAPRAKESSLDLRINLLEEQSLICDIVKNEAEKRIEANLCLENDLMTAEVYGYSRSPDDIKELQTKIIQPIVLFALFQGEEYDAIDDEDKKNHLIIALIRSLAAAKAI